MTDLSAAEAAQAIAELEASIRAAELRLARSEEERLRKLRRDAFDATLSPVEWFRRVLGLEVWSRQQEIAELVDRNEIVSVTSGQKTGKSKVAMAIALRWVCTHPRGFVILTSGNSLQVRSILWRELTSLVRGSGLDKAIGATLNDMPSNGFVLSDGRQILGFTAADKERMAGYSGDELLFVVDESSGIDEDIWQAIRGNLIGGGRALCMSNPTRTTGWFYERCTTLKDRSPVVRIDSRENPNYVEGRKVIPGLATREAVQSLETETGGEGSPIFAVRVEGKFPKQAANAVISAYDVETAVSRYAEARVDWRYPISAGVDPARFGDDDSAVQIVVGPYAFPAVSFHGVDTKQLAGLAKIEIQKMLAMRVAAGFDPTLHRADVLKPHVKIDVNGIGAGVFDSFDHDFAHVVGISGSESAIRDDKYVNRRSELWFDIGPWLKTGAMPPDSRRDVEFLAPTFSFGDRNRLKVESKDDIKKKIKRSPDIADAFAMAITNVPVLTPGNVGRAAGRAPAARGGWL